MMVMMSTCREIGVDDDDRMFGLPAAGQTPRLLSTLAIMSLFSTTLPLSVMYSR